MKTLKWVKRLDKELGSFGFINRFHHIFDHCRNEGDTLVGEPYGVSLEQLHDFIHFCERHGLRFYISGDGEWHPHTVKIVVERRKET